MRKPLLAGSLIGLLALVPSGCAVFDATSFGFAMLTGKRVVTVSGEAPRARSGEVIEAVNLRTGESVGRVTLNAEKRFSVAITLPMDEPLAIALRGENQAALILADRNDKRQEAREQVLSAGTTTVAWALGSVLAEIPVPTQGTWTVNLDQWKRLAERLPVNHGPALQFAAQTIETAGVGNPPPAAATLASALNTPLGTVRTVAGGHPRDTALWPPLLLAWADMLSTMPQQAAGDLLGARAAETLDIATAVDRVWAQHPYVAGQGGLEVRVPLREAGSLRVPVTLPATVKALRYRIDGALLKTPREGEIPRQWIRFEGGDAVLRVPDMPLGYTMASLTLIGENNALLGSASKDGLVSVAVTSKLSTSPIALSFVEPSNLTPGARE